MMTSVFRDFVVNLISGGNIALHVNFRFEKQKIVAINAKIDNAWGNEVRCFEIRLFSGKSWIEFVCISS